MTEVAKMIQNSKTTPNSLTAVLAVLVLASGPATAQDTCADHAVALQVLGSGGPIGVGRASTGYLIWIDGKARVMPMSGWRTAYPSQLRGRVTSNTLQR